ncbi:uncharacterized protein LOC129572629 [Sitodiplosis mosellana]|uniref:uncharacterized protein LOC129572629 n=1 Tax=Sitodiplosis mosellana TaxID=263140 RepID=UPI002443E8D3|nr:uncharacterized protein LOC129572629 [Sitodiplosis mosellana]XP_055308608.1 uncharacterized protein LOC129572629 [Sitodiplosis mosellana]
MYFIVFIIQTKEHVIVPHSWIKEINAHAENFINYGIHSNRKFMVFWTDKQEAFRDGHPLSSYEPNVLASTSSVFPNEGWYACYIKRFQLNWTAALAYKIRRRNIPPAIYNPSRRIPVHTDLRSTLTLDPRLDLIDSLTQPAIQLPIQLPALLPAQPSAQATIQLPLQLPDQLTVQPPVESNVVASSAAQETSDDDAISLSAPSDFDMNTDMDNCVSGQDLLKPEPEPVFSSYGENEQEIQQLFETSSQRILGRIGSLDQDFVSENATINDPENDGAISDSGNEDDWILMGRDVPSHYHLLSKVL